jgi:PAS domain S-box-containing protein
MKTTNVAGNGEVQLAGNAVLLNGLQVSETATARMKTAAGKKTEAGICFPSVQFAVSFVVTAIAIIWTSVNSFSRLIASGQVSVFISATLLLVCIVSWIVTTRALFRFQRRALSDAAAAAKERDRIRKECDLMRVILDNLPDCIYAKDKEGRFVLNNIAHARNLGAESPVMMRGKTDFDFFPRELAAQFFADEMKIMETGIPVINQEQYKEVHGSTTGEKRWSYTSKVVWRDEEGKVIGTAGVTRDIHENKIIEEALRHSEEKLRHSTMWLERSNRELQDFAYVASHDLQEPLRKIVVFGERLKEKCGQGLSDEGHDYIDRMQKAAARMQVLISDLLAFSRITTKAQPFTAVDLARAAHEVVSEMDARIEQVKGRVELGQLPIIQAEHQQMRQLLQSVIGNALKFHRPETPPVVRIEARIVCERRPRAAESAPPEELCVLTVSDNGIGFDEKYLNKIFNVFQRLHNRNEYEGTGMGLAIAKKIVLYHGGDITAKSKPGHGSTFTITLPVTHPKDRIEVQS